MGQKTHPTGNRLGFIKGWDSNWYGGKSYVDKIVEDDKIRKYLRARPGFSMAASPSKHCSLNRSANDARRLPLYLQRLEPLLRRLT